MIEFSRLSRMLGVLAVPMSAGLLLATAPASDTRSNAANPALALEEVRTILAEMGPLGECDRNCNICEDEERHEVFASQFGNDQGPDHSCQFSEQGCKDHNCGPDFAAAEDDIRRLAVLLGGGFDAQALVQLTQQSDRLIINPDRRAIQLLGCEDMVLLSIPTSGRPAEVLVTSE